MLKGIITCNINKIEAVLAETVFRALKYAKKAINVENIVKGIIHIQVSVGGKTRVPVIPAKKRLTKVMIAITT